MKFLAFLLSFYILVLNVIPCVDVPKDNTRQTISLSKSSNENHQQDIDHCSPFCTCDCCATPFVFNEYIIHFDCFLNFQKIQSEFSYSYHSSTYADIWQPPKIV